MHQPPHFQPHNILSPVVECKQELDLVWKHVRRQHREDLLDKSTQIRNQGPLRVPEWVNRSSHLPW